MHVPKPVKINPADKCNKNYGNDIWHLKNAPKMKRPFSLFPSAGSISITKTLEAVEERTFLCYCESLFVNLRMLRTWHQCLRQKKCIKYARRCVWSVFLPGGTLQTLDEVCRIHPPSVLLSPSATVQEVRGLEWIIISTVIAVIILSDIVEARYTSDSSVCLRGGSWG